MCDFYAYITKTGDVGNIRRVKYYENWNPD